MTTFAKNRTETGYKPAIFEREVFMKMSTSTVIEGTFAELLERAKTGSVIDLGIHKLARHEQILLGGSDIAFRNRNLFSRIVEGEKVSLGSHPNDECEDGPMGIVVCRRGKLYLIQDDGTEKLIYSGPVDFYKVGKHCVVVSYADRFVRIDSRGIEIKIPRTHEFDGWDIVSECDQVVIRRYKKFIRLQDSGIEALIYRCSCIGTAAYPWPTRWGIGLLHTKNKSISSLGADGTKTSFGPEIPNSRPAPDAVMFGRFGFVCRNVAQFTLVRPGGVQVPLGWYPDFEFWFPHEYGIVIYQKNHQLLLVVVKEE